MTIKTVNTFVVSPAGVFIVEDGARGSVSSNPRHFQKQDSNLCIKSSWKKNTKNSLCPTLKSQCDVSEQELSVSVSVMSFVQIEIYSNGQHSWKRTL